MIFNAILGWQNSATIGSVVSYCMYWLFVIVMFALLFWRELRQKKREAKYPLTDPEYRDEQEADGKVIPSEVAPLNSNGSSDSSPEIESTNLVDSNPRPEPPKTLI